METEEFVLLDIDYITKNHDAVIRLFGKLVGENKRGSITVLDNTFKPYIYVITSDIDACTGELSELEFIEVEKVCKNDMGELKDVLKVTFKHPQDIPKFREKILNLPSVKEVREHDIPFYRRYLIDKKLIPMNKIQVQGKVLNSTRSSLENETCIFKLENPPKALESIFVELKVLSFDIEVYNPQGMPNSEKDPIIMISFSSNQGLQKVFSTKNSSLDFVELVADERELLEKFAETVKSESPDLILGYNSDAFDFPYIRDRSAKLGVPLKLGIDGSQLKFMRRGYSNAAMIKGRVHIDLYSNVRRYLQLNSHTMEHVYNELFGEEKFDIPREEICNCWDEGGAKLENLFKYSMEDAVTITKIGEKMLPLSIELARIVGQPLFDVTRMATGQQVGWHLIRKAFEYGKVAPNQYGTFERNVVGGYVKEPVKGLHENIVYFDFRSLYPSIIISKNLSPDTLTEDDSDEKCHITPEFGYKFRKEPKGFIPSVIGKLLQDRRRIKSLMKECGDSSERQVLNVQQEALKRLANTMYGLFNHSTYRWYSIECSEAITAWGRDFLKKTMEKAEKEGFKVLYADTDGFFATYVGLTEYEDD